MPVQKTTREDILQRCWEVINLHGYKGSSISMLAKAAGLGKAGLLHHFGSKEDLMHEVLEFSMDFFRSYVLAVADEEPLPLEQRLEKMLRRQNRLAKIDQRGCFFTNVIMEMGQEGIHNELLMAFYDEWKQTFARLLGNVLPEEKAKEQAYLMLLQYEGAITLYKLTGDEMHLESFVDRYVQILSL
ncbi:TetR/AcrR family transcriptional regulator [Lewinella sp. LCG006]|uniref:TetR/AcrR family transcriptional regulator n=1 Tax=Lewinella sp. LCG006 TaxID=3231911 RepID=UPI00345F9213